MTVTVEYAETHLSDLLLMAGAGEEVLIAEGETTRVRLVAETAIPEALRARPSREAGTLRGILVLPENWEEEWARMGEELSEVMENGEIFPPLSDPE